MQVYNWKPKNFKTKCVKLACVTNNFNSTKLKCKSQHVLRHKRFWSADGNLILTEKSSHVLKSNTDNSLISRKHNVSMFSPIGECFTQYIYIYIYIYVYIYMYIYIYLYIYIYIIVIIINHSLYFKLIHVYMLFYIYIYIYTIYIYIIVIILYHVCVSK